MGDPGSRLKLARERAGYATSKQAAEAMGIPLATFNQHENGLRGIPPARAQRYAKFFRVSPEWLLYGSGENPDGPQDPRIVPYNLPVRFRVQAGSWFEVDGFSEEPASYERPVAPDPRYAAWQQWLEEVVGDSMDQRIKPGSFAHVVDAVDMGYEARHGDLVVIERRRAGGYLRERTIKEVAIKNGDIELWPRSNNPKWQTPVVLTAGAKPDEDIEVEIVGKVIGTYQSFD